MPWRDDKPYTYVDVWAPCDHDDSKTDALTLIAGRHLENVIDCLWSSEGWSGSSVDFVLDQWVSVTVEGWLDGHDRRVTVRVEGDYPLLVACEALRQIEGLIAGTITGTVVEPSGAPEGSATPTPSSASGEA